MGAGAAVGSGSAAAAAVAGGAQRGREGYGMGMGSGTGLGAGMSMGMGIGMRMGTFPVLTVASSWAQQRQADWETLEVMVYLLDRWIISAGGGGAGGEKETAGLGFWYRGRVPGLFVRTVGPMEMMILGELGGCVSSFPAARSQTGDLFGQHWRL